MNQISARDKSQEETLATLCKALSHPARVAIIKHLIQTDKCFCGDIVSILPLAQSTVSQHLRLLKESGLILGTVQGPNTCYCINKVSLNHLKELIRFLGESDQ